MPNKEPRPQILIIRLREVIRLTGLSRPTIYRRMNEGTFPKQVILGERAVGWRKHEVDNWLESLAVKGRY